jgi:hypothetical protein
LLAGWSEPERYFFTFKEAKYVSGRRVNRATVDGYWKATGKEKPVTVAVAVPGGGLRSFLVGMKRSLVFYRGRAPSGKKTEWVMHEYRLAGAGLAPSRPRTPPPAEGWVLCRLFRKKGSAAAAAEAAHADEEDVGDEEIVVADDDDEEEDASAAGPGSGFIDFFARAEAARGAKDEPPQRASSPVVSSSCLTDASLELQHQQETTSSSSGA